MKVNLMQYSKSMVITFMLFCFTSGGVIYAEEEGERVAAETAVAVDVIVNIDKESRTITLKNEDGFEYEFVAGPEVRNFYQLKRGDLVLTEYYSAFAVALEPKGSGLEERVSSTEVDRAASGAKPGMAITESIYVAATVTDIDLEMGTVTLQGPEASLTVTVDPELDLAAVEVGQEVEVAYIQSLAISVEPAPKVSGTLKMKIKAVALGVGVEWGSGSLDMYDGTTHEFKVSGLTLLDVGISGVEATGDVYHLVEAKDLEGTFFTGEAGAVLVKGASALSMKNRNDVVVKLKSAQKGARLTLAVEGLKIKLK